MWLLARNVIFTILVPGTVAGYIPYRIVAGLHDPFAVAWGLSRLMSVLLFTIGASIYFRCLWDFAVTGRGTPNIVDAPKQLVVTGLYRHVRNPMYIGVLMVIVSWAEKKGSNRISRFKKWLFRKICG